MKPFKYFALALLFGAAVAHFAPLAAQDMAGDDDDSPRNRLNGVWWVVITPRNCTTGDPIPNAAFESIYSFHADGLMSVSFRNNTTTLTRTLAHGLWERRRGSSDYSYPAGRNTYSFKFVHIRTTVATSAFSGKQESGGTLTLGDGGDEFTTVGYTQVYDPNGNPLPTQGCSTSVGNRFTLDQ